MMILSRAVVILGRGCGRGSGGGKGMLDEMEMRVAICGREMTSRGVVLFRRERAR